MYLRVYTWIILLIVTADLPAAVLGRAVSSSKTKDSGKLSNKCTKAIQKAIQEYGLEFVQTFLDDEDEAGLLRQWVNL